MYSFTPMIKPKILYFTDVLCGWCYAFGPVIYKVYDEYHERIDFELISGGLFIGESAGLINEVAPHIKQGAYKNVEELTGVTFGDAFLNGPLKNGSMVLNSVPPAMALCIVKEYMPEKVVEFADILHKAVYFDGMHPEDIPAYGIYAQKIGFNAQDFSVKMKDPAYYNKAYKDFLFYRKQDIHGFPTVVLEIAEKKIILVHGYASYEKFKYYLDEALTTV